MAFFDLALVRFGVSGTLILLYGIADHLARHRAPGAPVPSPRWLKPLIFLSISAFYLLIGPTGGALLGGWGNLAGIGLVGVAAIYRHVAVVRYPGVAARGLFYAALPLAVGVPWGWIALTVPAWVASLVCCVRAEKVAGAASPAEAIANRRFRLVPGVW
jgi:hypothetical protein